MRDKIQEAMRVCDQWRLKFKPTIDSSPQEIDMYNIFTRAKNQLKEML